MDIPGKRDLRWRVVLDTNVFVSGLRFGGKPQAILELAVSEGICFADFHGTQG